MTQQASNAAAVVRPGRHEVGPPRVRGLRRLRSIRFRLLVPVNAAMAVLVLALLALDYQRELNDRALQKQVALEEEAKTILPAVLRLRGEGTAVVREYLDAVCGRMRDADSPGHHIVIRLGDGADAAIVQATAHGRSSPELFRAIQAASRSPARQAEFRDREFVVGTAQAAGVTAYVSEELSILRRSVLGRVLWRLAGVLVLGTVAAALASGLLLRLVDKPLRRLVATVDRVAAGDFAARTRPFRSVELRRVSEAVNGMGAALEEAERRRRSEMAGAQRIQEHLLPREVAIPGLEFAALFRPASDVAGDYYDAIRLPDGTWLLCVADVAGHGVPAAMSAALLKAFLLHAAERHSAPDRLLLSVNKRFIAASPPGLFASMLLVRWNPTAGDLTYSSAGHEPAWLLPEGGEPRPLEATGLFLGIDEEAVWPEQSLPVRPGDRLLLLTDGIAETFGPRQELFGRDRLRQLLMRCRHEPQGELLGEIDRALEAHRSGAAPTDDVTVVAVEFVGPAEGAPERPRHTPQLSHSHNE